MSVEIELKLRIAPESLSRLKRHPLLKTLATTHAVTRKLHNIYFDTPSLELHKKAMALRLRRIGGKWLQTLKGGGGVAAGLHTRNEWETPVAGEALDFAAMKAAGGKLTPSMRKKLQPIFVTDFTRNIYQLNFEGAAIELSMDSGEIRTGEKTRPISELELELKSGRPEQLFILAQLLLDIVPLEVEYISKAEYGYRLYSEVENKGAVKARLPSLEKSQDISAALRDTISGCLMHIQANVPGALNKRDEEYLHQVRVGLRRLRVVLAMAETYRSDTELQALRERVSLLCKKLGRAREWDVFVTQTLPPISKHLPQDAGLRGIVQASEKRRAQQHAAVQEILASQEIQHLQLGIGQWMQGVYWQEPGSGKNLVGFAAQILEQRSKQVHQRGKNLAAADTVQLHELRIACKKLRYSAEMFGPLFSAPKASRFLATLFVLQDILGTLHDIAVARRLLDEMDNVKHHKTLALILGWIEHDYANRKTALFKEWKRFAEQGAFWV